MKMPSNVKCNCGHYKKDHYRGEGQCSKCGCTWYYPNDKWILKNYAKPGQSILDTHLGSGSNAIACYDYGCPLVAYEIDKVYYEAAIKRLDEHKKQLILF